MQAMRHDVVLGAACGRVGGKRVETLGARHFVARHTIVVDEFCLDHDLRIELVRDDKIRRSLKPFLHVPPLRLAGPDAMYMQGSR